MLPYSLSRLESLLPSWVSPTMGSSFCGSLQLQYTSGVRIGKPLPRAAHNEASNQREHEHSRGEISLRVRVIASDFPVAAFPSNISRKWHYGSLDHCAERYLLAMTRIRYGLGSCRKEGSCSASCRDDLYLKVLNMSRGGTPNLSSSVSGLPVVLALAICGNGKCSNSLFSSRGPSSERP